MDTYRVKFKLHYPDCGDDRRECYVLAESFENAERKVESRYKKECERAEIILIEVLDGEIIV